MRLSDAYVTIMIYQCGGNGIGRGYITERKEVVVVKVAMIGHKDFPSRSGGVEVMVGGLARSLVERGYDVTVYNRGLEKHHNVYDVDGVHARRVFTLQKPALNATIYSFLATFDALFRGYDYNKEIELAPGIVIRFVDVGHLLGSASIELWITEGETTTKLVFSGDIGNLDQPIIKDPAYIKEADYAFMESTYGDRSHGPKPDYVSELTKILQRTFDRGGNVVIPSFAVGRTQEMLYFIRKIKADGLVSNHADFPVYVDSPLAVEATGIFKQNERTCFDEEAMELVRQGINPITFPGLRLAITSDESKAINFDETPKVIISASGMCDAGRVRHHLKHNLWRPECTILFVGYQSIGTPGRALVDGVKEMRLFGETVDVNAQIRVLTGISGHADKNGLIDWIEGFETKPKKVFIVHGEDLVTMSFADCLKDEHGFDAFAPYSGTVFNLTTETFEKITEPVAVKKKTAEASGGQSSAYNRLVAAGQRLMALIGHCKGMANKDLAKFADQINSLCDKWN